MVLIGAPMYVCATATTPVALGLIAAGVSPGAALVLLLAGPATNVASLVVLYRELGRLLLGVYLGVLLATSVAAGILFDGLLSWLGVGIDAAAGSGAEFVPTLPPIVSVPVALLLLVLALISLRRTRAVEETVRSWAGRVGLKLRDRQVHVGLVGLAGLLWLSSGLFVVGPGERAAAVRFGRAVAPYVEPGLHFHWPAPIGGIERVPVGRVLRVVVGPSDPTHEGDGAWVLAGDENIVDVRAVFHYRIEDTPEAVSRWAFGVGEPRALLERVSEWALRTAVTRRSIDTLLTTDRGEVEREVAQELLIPALEDLELPVSPLEVNLAYVHAPATVHWSFRDVASSMEEKQERIHRAAADRQEILGEARGEVRARMSKADGRATEWRERARGEARAFLEQVEPYRRAPSLTRSRLHLETLDRALPSARIVVDLVPEGSGPNLWFADGSEGGERVPFERPESEGSQRSTTKEEHE
jgi:membrane protease subunit HflK